MMKRILFVLIVLLTATTIFSSCSASRKTGCPMSENIIH